MKTGDRIAGLEALVREQAAELNSWRLLATDGEGPLVERVKKLEEENEKLRAHIKELRGQARHTERYAEVLEGHVSRETRRAAWKSASMSRAALAGEGGGCRRCGQACIGDYCDRCLGDLVDMLAPSGSVEELESGCPRCTPDKRTLCERCEANVAQLRRDHG